MGNYELTRQERKIQNTLFGGDKKGNYPTNIQELAKGSGEPLEACERFMSRFEERMKRCNEREHNSR